MKATYEITENDDGIRPAGKPDACFYCGEAVGQKHRDDCVILIEHRNVRLVAHVRFESELSERYVGPEGVNQRFNEGTWCASNLIAYLEEYSEKHGCPCGIVHVEQEILELPDHDSADIAE